MTKVYGMESTTTAVLEGIILESKVAVITGATTGLGLETARSLACAGANVVILGRNQEKLDAAVQQVQAASLGKGGEVTGLILTLDNLDMVRESATEILKAQPKIDFLINNAGVACCPFSKTKQGLEMQFGTNHMGHFLLTCLLMPALLKSGDARIINLSSRGHRLSDVDLEDPNFESRPYDPWVSYACSKTANILFTVALDKRLKAKGVRSFAVHPGVIATELVRHMEKDDADGLMKSLGFQKSVEQGAATSVWGATSPELIGKGGVYLEDCKISKVMASASEIKYDGVAKYALDEDRAESLWKLSETICGEDYSW